MLRGWPRTRLQNNFSLGSSNSNKIFTHNDLEGHLKNFGEWATASVIYLEFSGPRILHADGLWRESRVQNLGRTREYSVYSLTEEPSLFQTPGSIIQTIKIV